MNLEDLVPSYTLCKMIPRGEFGVETKQETYCSQKALHGAKCSSSDAGGNLEKNWKSRRVKACFGDTQRQENSGEIIL